MKIRLQKNTHTKGIIVDGETVLISSHNWSESGVLFNRDAGLIIYDSSVAQYYEDIFLHDWNNCASDRIFEASTPMLLEKVPMQLLFGILKRISWDTYR